MPLFKQITLFIIRSKYGKTDYILDKSIIMGDMNADCDYLSQTKQNSLDLGPPGNYWPIDGDTDTTVAASLCAYDR